MKVFNHKSGLSDYLEQHRCEGQKIGLVPTMGALHEGHTALLEACLEESDLTVCSIFVNPAQFNNREDLLKYPKSLSRDLELLKAAGCDVVYAPEESDLYDGDHSMMLKFDFGTPGRILEGHFRPGHFNGVALVVSKLFNIIRPDYTYFGQKDLQQYFIIECLIRDLSYPVHLRKIPTVREKDGLALSSRNRRIPEELRPEAALFHKSLQSGRSMLRQGISFSEVKEHVEKIFSGHPELELEYYELVDTRDFSITDAVKDGTHSAICIAGYLNNIRLIDNVMYI